MLRRVRLGLERLEERETPSTVVPGSDPTDPSSGGSDPSTPPAQSPTDPAPPTGEPG